MKDVVELFKAARRAATPLIAISTADQIALSRRIFAAVNGKGDVPKFTWDIMRGMQATNSVAESALAQIPEVEQQQMANPPSMLAAIRKFPDKSLIVMMNAQRFLEDITVAQGICNLRDEFIEGYRTLLMLGPAFKLPLELQDVVLLDEPRPSDEELTEICQRVLDDTYGEKEKLVSPAHIDAVRGLSPFTAEQVYAMSLNEEGVSEEELRARKREEINQTRGLEMRFGDITLDSLGGLDSAKKMATREFNGRVHYGAVVFIDEGEKAIAGATGSAQDSSGVSQDFMARTLNWMEERRHGGIIACGVPGSGKTAFAQAIGGTFGRPTITLDPGGLKGSHVGESEQYLREALKVIDSIAPQAFFVLTCNKLDSLPPEFQRRFTGGVWYFDLPTQEEREMIWNIHLDAHDLPRELERPDDHNWTGAEIRNCCNAAWRLDISLTEASAYIVPVSKSNPGSIEALRKSATGSWLSASHDGTYTGVKSSSASKRKVQLDG